MRRTSLALSAVVVALLLCACSTGGAPAPEGAAPPASQTTDDAPATSTNGWAADPACADFVAQRSAAMEEAYDQHAEVASIDDLPFTFATTSYGWDGDAVACVWDVFRADATEPAAMELLVYAVEGDITYPFAANPDLTAKECATDDSAGCFVTASGAIVVVTKSAIEGTDAFSSMVGGVGIQNLGG